MRLTDKQYHILTVLKAGNLDGSLVDLDELLERLPYTTTKASLQFSLRALIKHDLIAKAGSENRRDRRRRLLALTAHGMAIMTAGVALVPDWCRDDVVEEGFDL